MIQAAGLHVLAVGLGEPKHARRYCGKLAPSIDCITNEKTSMHRRYGLEELSVFSIAKPGLIAAGVRAGKNGHMQGKSTGNVKMLPGTFIIDQSGIVRAAYYSDHAGDHPNLTKLIESANLVSA